MYALMISPNFGSSLSPRPMHLDPLRAFEHAGRLCAEMLGDRVDGAVDVWRSECQDGIARWRVVSSIRIDCRLGPLFHLDAASALARLRERWPILSSDPYKAAFCRGIERWLAESAFGSHI